jgi:benzoate membrane transport protein
MLITSAAGVPMAEAIGGFVVCAVLMTLAGFTGAFERVMNRLPLSLASGMLAGVLLRFGLDVFGAMKTELALVLPMFVAYLALRRLRPRYAVVGALALGVAIAGARGLLRLDAVELALTTPLWTTPRVSIAALFGIALPLFVVTMASQNIPGVAVMRASGFHAPVSPLVGWTGAATLVLAPFGAFALNLAAITAAICMGREAHEDPQRRYVAAVCAGGFYLLLGVFGATVAALFAALPQPLVLAIAGLALLGTIGNGLAAALASDDEREPALVTFLVTASGVAFAGVGSAFWGLVAGLATLAVLRAGR